jgi:spore germination cell wall hydrolase CwlJ-like protein
MVKVVSFLLTFLTVLLITTPTNSNVTLKEPHYWKPLRYDNIRYTSEDLDCLAKNIYFEAGVESTAGKLAVANVTINRILSKEYPNSVCGVVKEGRHYYSAKSEAWEPFRDMCQFSWYCDGRRDDPNPGRTWESSKDLAKIVLRKHQQDILIDITDGATHYHANWMESFPRWSEEHKKVASIDRHIFYKARKRHKE